MSNKHYQAGQILWVDLGSYPDQVVGHEQANARPCVVIRHFVALDLLIILPMTSVPQNPKHFSVIPLNEGVGGLAKKSYVLCHHIRSVSSQRITFENKILPKSLINTIKGILMDVLEL